jgi:hypothetical protein
MTTRKIKVIYCYFTAGAISGMGANSRVNGFCRNLEQSGILDQIDFSLAGVSDFEIVPDWMPYLQRAIKASNPRLLVQYTSPEDLKSFDSQSYRSNSTILQGRFAGLSATLGDQDDQIDLLIVDSHPQYVANFIANGNPLRPANVWAVIKQTPGLFQGIAPLSFDRCYFLEPFQPQFWTDQLCREYCRTPAELEHGRGYQDPHITADDYVKGDKEAERKWAVLNDKFTRLHAQTYKNKKEQEAALTGMAPGN